MVWWHAALWAVAGGFVVEALEFAALLRKHRKWPWEVDAEAASTANSTAAGPLGYFIGELLRLIAGGLLGAALAGQITGVLPALAAGAAAPGIVGQLLAYAPLPSGTGATNTPSAADASSPATQTGPSNNGSVPIMSQQQAEPAAVATESLPERGGAA